MVGAAGLRRRGLVLTWRVATPAGCSIHGAELEHERWEAPLSTDAERIDPAILTAVDGAEVYVLVDNVGDLLSTVPPVEAAMSRPPSPQAVEPPPPRGAGDWAVSILGTPYYLAFKAVTGVAGAAIAAPLAALAGPTPAGGKTIAVLGERLAQNCGPPYVLTPLERVAVPAVE
jgi:hypothetical protein